MNRRKYKHYGIPSDHTYGNREIHQPQFEDEELREYSDDDFTMNEEPVERVKNSSDDEDHSSYGDAIQRHPYTSSSSGEEQHDIQIKVQARKALKDSKRFLHSTTKQMEHKIAFSQNNSLMEKMLESSARNKDVVVENLLHQMVIRNSKDWFLNLSFEQCYTKIRNIMRETTFSSERNKAKFSTINNTKIHNSYNRREGDGLQNHNDESRPVPEYYQSLDPPSKLHKNQQIGVVRIPKNIKEEKPFVSTPRKPVQQVSSKQRLKKHKYQNRKLYHASEEEMMALEAYFGPELALDILEHADTFVSFQKYWRTNRKYRFNRKVQELRSMFQTTLFEMERAKLENYDTEDYARQIKYLASQFCIEMNPAKPYTPGPIKQSNKIDKHSFLHRKEEPTFLKKVKKKKKRGSNMHDMSKSSPQHPSPPVVMNDQQAVVTTPNEQRNDSIPASSTPKRTPPIPSLNSAFNRSVKTIGSISPKRFQLQSNNQSHECAESTTMQNVPSTPIRSAQRKTLSSRVFKLQSRLDNDRNNNSNTDLTPEAALSFEDPIDFQNRESSSIVEDSFQSNSSLSSRRDDSRELSSLPQFQDLENVSAESGTNDQTTNNTNRSSNTPTRIPLEVTTNLNQELVDNEGISFSPVSLIPPLSPILRRAPPPPLEHAESEETKSNEEVDEEETITDIRSNTVASENNETRDALPLLKEPIDDVVIQSTSLSDDHQSNTSGKLDLEEFEQQLQMESKYFSPKILFEELDRAEQDRMSCETFSHTSTNSDEENFNELHILQTSVDDYIPANNSKKLTTLPSGASESTYSPMTVFNQSNNEPSIELLPQLIERPNSTFKPADELVGVTNSSKDSNVEDVVSKELQRYDSINASKSSHSSTLGEVTSTPRPPSRKPPQPSLSLEELVEKDRVLFAEIENLVFSLDESSVIFQFDRNYVYSGFKNSN
ncbi:hypothetical protein C9374_010633 [Naegleria lovaniensis]|uniref:Uncharacterized protein n=1 Tax=Naegleria lovaniensis TaxID=51637 RepID=A0AA88KFL0_NAELO|nr:uncharacterized protein C9374_010633 [Naegleria lovaniensis]KAG2374614.1 hypothetical protein C9374_010633 [Naegleria lovaniensis]